jgi:Ima1 N-terminal domain
MTKGFDINGRSKVIWLKNGFTTTGGDGHHLKVCLFGCQSMNLMFRRHSNIQCFFCQSPNALHLNPHNFKCTSCGCWNRYDSRGEIISDEPAMHEEHLNSKSFAKRGRSHLWFQNDTSAELSIASPSKDRLPTMYGSGPFCHSCQTNQMLIVNLLSNYLPSQEVHATFTLIMICHIF